MRITHFPVIYCRKVTQRRAEVLHFGSLPVQQIYDAESVPKYHFENGLPDPSA